MENWKKAKGSAETTERVKGSAETKEKVKGSAETKEKVKGSAETKEAAGKSPRVASIDVFRGMALCLMIFANYGAGQYWAALVHATWDGITLSDFAFPL